MATIAVILDGEQVKERMAKERLSQANLAELMGYSPAAICLKLNGERGCSLTDVAILAEVLDCNMADIIKTVEREA